MTINEEADASAGFRSRPFQAGVFVLGIAGLWLIVLFASSHLPVDLTVVLLILLTVVVAIALFTAPALAVLTALIAVILVNWYLVPPYRTFEISNPDNVAALTVFALVAAVSSVLVGASTRARSRMRTSESRAGIIRTVVASDESSSEALARVRDALELGQLDLLKAEGVSWLPVATSGPAVSVGSTESNIALDVPMGSTYRLVGRGAERFAVDPGFVESLAAAVVRSYESEQMRTEQQRAKELEAIDQARTALLASVGHDLRTPLSSLRLAVDALQSTESQLDDVSRSELLETVDDATARLNEMITDMLDLSRLEAGVLLAQPQPVSLHEVVAGATLAWSEGLVRSDVPEDLPSVIADPVLLERVIENLVSNAIRHGGATPDEPVTITARRAGEHVELRIRDNGPGLPEGHPGLQTPLTADGRADASSGLGLAIVVAFTRAMDIAIEFLSPEGHGLAVRLDLKQVGR
jgi:two-component system sensor histidine kinase KdpD